MPTILVDGKEHEVDLRRLTLLCHKDNVQVEPNGQVLIGPEQTLARSALVTDDEWVALMADPIYQELIELVFGAGMFPMVPQLKDCGTGVRHITGLILMFAELEPGQTPFVRFPEAFLHPSSQSRLADLFIRFTGKA